jgi:Ni,Fe-hydrogenase III small subunit/Pyruvate/2-oxoacid:ferredoxin oxidoreductase delta subunit
MIKTLLARLHQGYRTNAYPKKTPALPDRFRGMPSLDAAACTAGCTCCVGACPTSAVSTENGVSLDLGACTFCAECAAACPTHALRFTRGFELSARNRNDLLTKGNSPVPCAPLEPRLRSLFGRSLKLRQVSAGGCGACEADINVLSTIVWDIGRFGIQVVASPRHADGLIVTGPVTENMRVALKKTYDALPSPKLVIACGACAISGGLYRTSIHQHGGVDSQVPVDLYIPGCPPHPLTILHGLLRLIGRA